MIRGTGRPQILRDHRGRQELISRIQELVKTTRTYILCHQGR